MVFPLLENIFLFFYDKLSEKGFAVNFLNSPSGIGFVFTSANVDRAEEYMKSIKEINDLLNKEKPDKEKPSDTAKLYGLSYTLPLGIATDALENYPDIILDS